MILFKKILNNIKSIKYIIKICILYYLMTLISSNTKSNIIFKLNDIVNIEDPEWSNLGIELKIKVLHNLCNYLKTDINYSSNQSNSPILCRVPQSINIPLKNQRPKKIIELCGINKQSYSELFEEFRKGLVITNKEFRKKYNSKNKNYCFANLPNSNYRMILKNYNGYVYNFINKNIDKIDSIELYNNLMSGNQQKIITKNNSNINDLKISNINMIDEFLNIEFNNNVSIKLELYLTSEKITSNIPAKYKIFLTNIF